MTTSIASQSTNNNLTDSLKPDYAAATTSNESKVAEHGTTKFQETEQVVSTSTRTNINYHSLGPPKFDDNSIADFLAKPVIVKQGTALNTDVVGKNLFSFTVGETMKLVTMWMRKLAGYAYFRGTAHVRIQINPQPFQQGRWLCHFMPNQNFSGPGEFMFSDIHLLHNRNLQQKSQHPNVELDFRDGSAEMKIPYVSPTYYYNLQDANAAFDWGTMYVDVLSPFRSAAGGVDPIEYTVWMSFTDVELSGPTYMTQSEWSSGSTLRRTFKSGRAKINYMENEEKKGPISTALNAAKSVSDALTTLPLVDTIASPISSILDVGNSIASAFGWAKPFTVQETNIDRNRSIRSLPNAQGYNTGDVLAINSNSKLEPIEGIFGSNVDEMSFAYLKKIPVYFDTRQLNVTDLPGRLITTIPVNPTAFAVTDHFTTGGATYSCMTDTPFGFLAKYFRHWRGSFDITLKFVKTEYHSARIAVTWTPYTNTARAATTTFSETGYVLRDIVDIRNESQVTFNLPYLVEKNYLRVNQPGTFSSSGGYDSISGYFQVWVVNPLQAAETVSQTIDMLLYVNGGDDLDLTLYDPFLGSGPPHNSTILPPVSSSFSVQPKWETQSGIGNSKENHKYLENNLCSTGDPFLSIKQIISIGHELWSTDTKAQTTLKYDLMTIYSFNGTGGIQKTAFPTDIIAQLSTGFLYRRGGMRYIIPNTGQMSTASARLRTIETPVVTYTNTDGEDAFNTGLPNYSLHAMFPFVDGSTDVTIPYYGRTPFNFCWQTNVNNVATGTYLDNRIYLAFNSAAQKVQRMCADDFAFGCFIGFAPYCFRVTAV